MHCTSSVQHSKLRLTGRARVERLLADVRGERVEERRDARRIQRVEHAPAGTAAAASLPTPIVKRGVRVGVSAAPRRRLRRAPRSRCCDRGRERRVYWRARVCDAQEWRRIQEDARAEDPPADEVLARPQDGGAAPAARRGRERLQESARFARPQARSELQGEGSGGGGVAKGGRQVPPPLHNDAPTWMTQERCGRRRTKLTSTPAAHAASTMARSAAWCSRCGGASRARPAR